MKRKIFALFAVLIMCLTPMMFLAGCGAKDTESSVTIEYSSWKVVKDQSFNTSTVDGLKITYTQKGYDSSTGKYRWLANKEGTAFSDEPVNLTIDSFEEAKKQGLMVFSGFDSSEIKTGLTMKVTIFGVVKDVTYDVVAAS